MTQAARVATEEISVYDAFGLKVAGASRFMDGHGERLAEFSGRPDLTVEVMRGPFLPDPGEVPSLEILEAEQKPGQRFWRRFDRKSTGTLIFQLLGGSAIECGRNSDILRVYMPEKVREEAIGAFIFGAGLVFYFKTLGKVCLHAAVLSRYGSGLAVCGPSGAGKSSLATALTAQGWSLVAEDLAVVEQTGADFWVRPGYGRVRLWSESLSGLGQQDQAAPIISGADKYYLRLPTDSTRVRLREILFLDRYEEGPFAMEISSRLPVTSAMANLYRNSLLPYANRAEEAAGILAGCQGIASAIPCAVLRLRSGFEHLGSAVQQLTERAWALRSVD